MKTLLKILGLTFLLLFLLESSLSAQDSSEILKIRRQYNAWQRVLNKETLEKGKEFFKISKGEKFGETKWVNKISYTVDETTGCVIWSSVNFIKDDQLGSMFYIFGSDPSGDLDDVAEHYYWPTGELYFVYWGLNTTLADEPSRVERRLYFNKAGKLIKSLESVYKLGTQEKIHKPNYCAFDMRYWKNIREVPFYNLLNYE